MKEQPITGIMFMVAVLSGALTSGLIGYVVTGDAKEAAGVVLVALLVSMIVFVAALSKP